MATNRTPDTRDRDVHRASLAGLYLTALGALVLLVSLWMDWITTGPADSEANPASGYEADGVIPLLVFLAVGLAGLLWTVAFAIDPISTIQYPDQNVTIEAGLWLGLVGTLLWTVGSYLLAKEPEGDDEHTDRTVVHTETVRGTGHATGTVGQHEHLGTHGDPITGPGAGEQGRLR